MPRYEVLEPGFFEGKLFKPGHPKHGVVHTDMPLKPVPIWLKLMPDETAGQKTKRVAKASKSSKAAVQKKAEDEADIKGASFLADAGGTGSTVEPL